MNADGRASRCTDLHRFDILAGGEPAHCVHACSNRMAERHAGQSASDVTCIEYRIKVALS
ncbi:MAG: hypothetical protein CVV18_08135 [Gammaproteobacteria bacterium HGW-Gammaproteobacteria-8]|nr:MAG: hypothetical protein CVV18_08135 [Gammaproteobacteria bacterium HGW-Gammaproteobacteria-8]